MKVLLYTPSFYPKVDGLSKRVDHFVRCLSKIHGTSVMNGESSGEEQDFTLSNLKSGVMRKQEDGAVDCTLLIPRDDSMDIQQLKDFPATIIQLASYRPLSHLAPETLLANSFGVLIPHLCQIILELKPDVIHVVGPDAVFISFYLALKYCKFIRPSDREIQSIALVTSYHQHTAEWVKHQPISNASKWLFKSIFQLESLLNLADAVISISNPIKEYLNKEKHITCNYIWPPAVDNLQFRPCYEFGNDHANWRKVFTFDDPEYDTVPILLYVGRCAPEKSLHWLVHMMDYLKQLEIKAYLVIVGTGILHWDLVRLHGKENRVFYSGCYWKDEQLSQAYAASDIFVFPSSFDTLGNVCIEALASGNVVVARNRGGVSDLVDNSRGRLVEETDHQDSKRSKIQNFCDNVVDIIRMRESWIVSTDEEEEGDTHMDHDKRIYNAVNGLYNRTHDYPKLIENAVQCARDKSWEASSQAVYNIYDKIIRTKQQSLSH
ncbi:hypothetical protein MP228_007455 [Amoeboaphelidium protococcarum]|nr:hypothetical protein MP228_007455 [Amoeboaphelidium protococcarum]